MFSTTTPSGVLQQQQQQQQQQPRLYQNWKLAFQVLYGGGTTSGNNNSSTPLYNTILPTNVQAHEYLLHFQSRNVRRKIISIQQKYRDQQNRQHQKQKQSQSQQQRNENNINNDNDHNTKNNAVIETGSTWLTCLAVLCCPIVETPTETIRNTNTNVTTATEIERLFVSQTIVHRIRRSKLIESIDMEMENIPDFMDQDQNEQYIRNLFQQHQPSQQQQQQLLQHDSHVHNDNTSSLSSCIQLVQSYQSWMMNVNPFIGTVLMKYQIPTLSSSSSSSFDHLDNMEERVKGELTVLTLAAVSYYLLSHSSKSSSSTGTSNTSTTAANTSNSSSTTTQISSSSSSSSFIGPIVTNCLSALITVLARLRYTPAVVTASESKKITAHNSNTTSSSSSSTSPTPYTVPIVQTIHHLFDTVWQTVLLLQQHQQQQESEIIYRMVVFQCVSLVPDTIMGQPGGARGKMSIDPRCIQAIVNELRTIDIHHVYELFVGVQQAQSVSSSSNTFDLNVVQTITKWATYMPLTKSLLDLVLPILQKFLNQILINTTTVTATTTTATTTTTQQQQQQQYKKMVNEFLLALYESAAYTVDQILVVYLGLNQNQQSSSSTDDSGGNNNNKFKKSSNKSKKRQQCIVDATVTDDMIHQAQMDQIIRGEMACQGTFHVWESFYQHLVPYHLQQYYDINTHISNQLEHQLTYTMERVVDGEGPIGCLAACANACLPHIIRQYYYNNNIDSVESSSYHQLFVQLTIASQSLCTSSNKSVRSLLYEPLYTLHSTIMETMMEKEQQQQQNTSSSEFQNVIVDHFFKCSMSLATVCGYPVGYFDQLGEPSEEEIEVERNDVRDLLRTVSGGSIEFSIASTTGTTSANNAAFSSSSCSNDGTTASNSTLLLSDATNMCVQIVSKILEACRAAMSIEQQQKQPTDPVTLFPETAAHAFSALAKPLNQLAKFYYKFIESNLSPPVIMTKIFHDAFHILLKMNNTLIEAFNQSVPCQVLLPLSRIVNLAIASITPMLSSLVAIGTSTTDNTTNPNTSHHELREGVTVVLTSAIHHAILSLVYLPELYAPSILDHSMYDIRGAMRGPGGEDHVGCLSLMRLAIESDVLTNSVVNACKPFVPRLCQLHQELKTMELNRERGCFHGTVGVAPQSRRILVKVLCHLEIKSQGQLGASDMLSGLFNATLDNISTTKKEVVVNEDTLFLMSESIFDLAAFSPIIVESLFNENGTDPRRIASLEAMTSACIQGYRTLMNTEMEGIIYQWNRLRASLFMLLKLSANPDYPLRACEIIMACITAECDIIQAQCNLGPFSPSHIFKDGALSPDGVPAGLFVKLLADAVANSGSTKSLPKPLLNCLQLVHSCKTSIMDRIVSKCPDPAENAFVDPRSTLAECWFLLLNNLIETGMVDQNIEQILMDSFILFISLLFNPSMAKTKEVRRQDPGMSLDGPQSRTGMMFLENFFLLGSQPLVSVGQRLITIVPIDGMELQQWSDNPNFYGISIIGAALFRANQGSLPPWAVESIPDIYRAFFHSLQKDVASFVTVIHLSMRVRLSPNTTESFGMVQPGHLLSGKIFSNMSEKAKITFIDDVTKLCQKDDGASWRRMKATVKQICGGKKKETDFGQKPPLTKWEFVRI